jgi:hypothetical protein
MTRYCEEYVQLLGKGYSFRQDWESVTFYKPGGNYYDLVKYTQLNNEIEKLKKLDCCKKKGRK